MKVVALAGGVGGAKFAHGLAQILQPEELTVVVNTGDDFEQFGLFISPDLDTVCYTLAGIANPDTGWGRNDESWRVLAEIRTLGGPDWFNLGDLDLATHIMRSFYLKEGAALSQITRRFCQAWGIQNRILPMTDDRVPTIILTQDGRTLSFQDYFVHLKCEPAVEGFRFDGMEDAKPADGVLEAIHEAELVIICPSNPWVSIQPILGVPGMRENLADKRIIAISPIIGGRAVKGPAAKMYAELGFSSSALAVAQTYRGLISALVVDQVDADQASQMNGWGIMTLITDTIMKDVPDRGRLAREVLQFYTARLLGEC